MESPLVKSLIALRAAWRNRWLGIAVAWGLAVCGGAAIFLMKDRYEATASVYVDTQSVLKPLMTGLAFQPDIDQQVRMLARTLISRPNVERLMQIPSIGLDPYEFKDHASVVDKLLESIKVVPSGAGGNLYAISYRDTDPARARRLVEKLVALFVEAGLGENRKDSEEAGNFIDEQIRSYEGKLSESENRLKDFKLRNFGLTGTSNQDYFSRMSALSEFVSKLRVDLRAAEQGRDALKRELANEEPQLPLEVPVTNALMPATDVETRLEVQKRQLDELSRRFTDEHPDVIATRRTIALLETQRQQELASRAKAPADRTRASAATSPVFQRLRISAAEAEANVASLRSQLGEQQMRLDQIRATAGRVPQVEADLAQLNRDYDIVRQKYDQLVARRESASLGVKIDQSAQLADFRLVEPPRVSPKPVPPSRLVLALMTIVLSVVGGSFAAYAMSVAHPAIESASEVQAISGRPVLGAASLFVSDGLRMIERQRMVSFVSLAVFLVAAQVGWAAWLSLTAKI